MTRQVKSSSAVSSKVSSLKVVNSGSEVQNTSLIVLLQKPTTFPLYLLLPGLTFKEHRLRIASLSLYYVQSSFLIQSSITVVASGMAITKGRTSAVFFVSLGPSIHAESCQYCGVIHTTHTWSVLMDQRFSTLVPSDYHVSPLHARSRN